MAAIVECCAGLDVHQATVVACANGGPSTKRSRKEVRTFGTTRAALEEMRDWLTACGCTLVAMESTGIYWHPVYAAPEGHCGLARHGLIARSFVPPRPIRDLRDPTRYRRKLSRAQAAERNRLIKLPESANIKLSGLISDVFGVSGQAMLLALIEGEETPAEMAQHARKRMRRMRDALARALNGTIDAHHRLVLRMQFARIKAAEADPERIGARLRETLAPYAEPLGRLMRIPGVNWITAATIIAEIGVDRGAFVSAAHPASWTGICPGNPQSAGKQKTGKVRKGNVHLKTALVTAAMGAAKTRGCYLGEKHRRLRARRGQMRVHVAIAHRILVAASHILAAGSDYQDPGPTCLDKIDQRRTAGQLARRLRDMGYAVDIRPKAA